MSSSIMTSGAEIRKTGYLIKQGHIRKNWLRRWWVLKRSGTLTYLENEKAVKHKGVIHIRDYHVQTSNPGTLALKGAPTPHVIHLVPNNLSGGKPFFMCADSQEDCEEWAREISAVSYELQETEFRKRESDLDDSGSRICSAHDTSESRDSTVEEDDEDSKLEWVDLNLNTDASVFLVGAETRVGSVIMSELLKEELVVRVLLTRESDVLQEWKDAKGDIVVVNDVTPSVLRQVLSGLTKLVISSTAASSESFESSLLEAAKDEGIKQVVRVSPAGCSIDQSSQSVQWHSRIDDKLKGYGFQNANVIHHGALMQLIPFLNPGMESAHEVRFPCIESYRVSWIDASDVAAMVAVLLKQQRHFEQTLTATGFEALNGPDLAKILSSETGDSYEFHSESAEEAKARWVKEVGLNDARANVLSEMCHLVEQDVAGDISDDLEMVLDRKPTSFRSFAARHFSKRPLSSNSKSELSSSPVCLEDDQHPVGQDKEKMGLPVPSYQAPLSPLVQPADEHMCAPETVLENDAEDTGQTEVRDEMCPNAAEDGHRKEICDENGAQQRSPRSTTASEEKGEVEGGREKSNTISNASFQTKQMHLYALMTRKSSNLDPVEGSDGIEGGENTVKKDAGEDENGEGMETAAGEVEMRHEASLNHGEEVDGEAKTDRNSDAKVHDSEETTG